MTRIPSSLIRAQASGAIPKRKSNDPTAAERAMWPSDKLKSYYERRGEWGLSEEDKESLAYSAAGETARGDSHRSRSDSPERRA